MRPHDSDPDDSDDGATGQPLAHLTKIYHTERAHRLTSVPSILSIISAGFINTLLMVVPDAKFAAWVTEIKDEAAKAPQYPVYVHDKAFSLRTNIGRPSDKARYSELNKARVVITKYELLRKEYDAVWTAVEGEGISKSDFFRQHWSLIVLLEADRELLKGSTGLAAAMLQVVAKGKRYVVWDDDGSAEGAGGGAQAQKGQKKKPAGRIRGGNIAKRAAKRRAAGQDSDDDDDDVEEDENGAGPSRRRAKPKKAPTTRTVKGVLQKQKPAKKKQKISHPPCVPINIDGEDDEEIPEDLPLPNQSNKITRYFKVPARGIMKYFGAANGGRRDSGHASENENIFVRHDDHGADGVNGVDAEPENGGMGIEQLLAELSQQAANGGADVVEAGWGEHSINIGGSAANMLAAPPVINGLDADSTMNDVEADGLRDSVANASDVINGTTVNGGGS